MILLNKIDLFHTKRAWTKEKHWTRIHKQNSFMNIRIYTCPNTCLGARRIFLLFFVVFFLCFISIIWVHNTRNKPEPILCHRQVDDVSAYERTETKEKKITQNMKKTKHDPMRKTMQKKETDEMLNWNKTENSPQLLRIVYIAHTTSRYHCKCMCLKWSSVALFTFA